MAINSNTINPSGRITLAALLNVLEPTIYLSIFYQLSQYEYEAVTRGTVEELRAGRCAEVCGDNIIRKIIVDTVMRPVDKSGPGLALDVVIGALSPISTG